MKPSDIHMWPSTPLTDTFGKTEAEQGAGMLISIMAKDDDWRPVSMTEMRAWLVASTEALKNPFYRPNMTALRESMWNRGGR